MSEEKKPDALNTFCYMIVEEFLMNKKMGNTLEAFRSEWARPEEPIASKSWYEIALKLRLPDLLETTSNSTIIESMTHALASESSLKSRQPVEVVVSGLAEMPKEKTIGMIETNKVYEEDGDSTYVDFTTKRSPSSNNISLPTAKGAVTNSVIPHPIRKMKHSTLAKRNNQALSKTSKSSEIWIPETTRLKSIARDLSVAENNLYDQMMRETETKREMRRFQTSDIDKARNEESLGSKKKETCACCLQLYSYVNLVMKIPQKAVVDIRKKWSKGATDGWWCADDDRLSLVPRCYDGVMVCRFCSQFFYEQEKYRPSFASITTERKHMKLLEAQKREKEYWDPLLMCEKDRAQAEGEDDTVMNKTMLSLDRSMSTIDYD